MLLGYFKYEPSLIQSIFAVDLLLPVQFMQNNVSRWISLMQLSRCCRKKVEHCRKKKSKSDMTQFTIQFQLSNWSEIVSSWRRQRNKAKHHWTWQIDRGQCYCIRSIYQESAREISWSKINIRTGSSDEYRYRYCHFPQITFLWTFTQHKSCQVLRRLVVLYPCAN